MSCRALRPGGRAGPWVQTSERLRAGQGGRDPAVLAAGVLGSAACRLRPAEKIVAVGRELGGAVPLAGDSRSGDLGRRRRGWVGHPIGIMSPGGMVSSGSMLGAARMRIPRMSSAAAVA